MGFIFSECLSGDSFKRFILTLKMKTNNKTSFTRKVKSLTELKTTYSGTNSLHSELNKAKAAIFKCI